MLSRDYIIRITEKVPNPLSYHLSCHWPPTQKTLPPLTRSTYLEHTLACEYTQTVGHTHTHAAEVSSIPSPHPLTLSSGVTCQPEQGRGAGVKVYGNKHLHGLTGRVRWLRFSVLLVPQLSYLGLDQLPLR